MHCNAATWNFITSRKSHPRTGIGGPSKQQRVVLRRRNTVVGGKCALPSALLVLCVFILHAGQPEHPTSRTDGQTHRQTDNARRHRPRLCIASLGKNVVEPHVHEKFSTGSWTTGHVSHGSAVHLVTLVMCHRRRPVVKS